MARRTIMYYPHKIETYLNEQLHSFDDKPAVKYNNGSMFWMQNGVFHRNSGPSYIYGNTSVYYHNGQLIDIKNFSVFSVLRFLHCTFQDIVFGGMVLGGLIPAPSHKPL